MRPEAQKIHPMSLMMCRYTVVVMCSFDIPALVMVGVWEQQLLTHSCFNSEEAEVEMFRQDLDPV